MKIILNSKIVATGLIIALFIFIAYGSEDSKNSQKASIDCSHNSSYGEGYSSGSLVKMVGGPSTCESYVEKYNYETGRNILSASDCFCEGFQDGINGDPKKYSENENVENQENIDDEYHPTENSNNQTQEKDVDTSYTNLSPSNNEKFALKDNLENLYNEINTSSLKADRYFSNHVEQYITLKNITPEQIDNLYKDEEEYTHPTITIVGDINYLKTENDIKYYDYWINYSCFRVSKNKYQNCQIFVEIGLNESNIVSLKEKQIKNLNYTTEKL